MIHDSLADAVSGELVVAVRLVEDPYDAVRPTLDLPKRTLILMEGVISARICVIVVQEGHLEYRCQGEEW